MKNERRKYMNNSKQDILNNLIKEPFINQRILAAQTGHSLGIVNRSIKELISEGYLDEEIRPTEKTLREAKEKAPKNRLSAHCRRTNHCSASIKQQELKELLHQPLPDKKVNFPA